MTQEHRSRAPAVLVALGALLLTAPTPPAALALLGDAGSSTDPTGPLVAAVALLAWCTAGWLALTVAVVLLSRLPGLLGRTAGCVAALVAPPTVRRTVEAALGLTVAVAVLTPTAALAAPSPGPAAAAVEAAWDLDWPDPAAAPPAPAPVVQPAPVVRPVVQPVAAAPTATAVVVRTGDSLWSIAEAALRDAGADAPSDRQVAQAWPSWWAANRTVVGDDPDLLLPGTVLRPPPDHA